MANHHPIPTIIVGAAGRDFHEFNMRYREDQGFAVVAFTASQIPGVENRVYPPELAGPHYPDGIPVVDETRLAQMCRDHAIERVHFAYSDVSHEQVMHTASIALACGADFVLGAPRRSMVAAPVPVIATSAVRTGCGKSQLTRWLARYIADCGLRPIVVRHPMPYGNLRRQAVQRFASHYDLDVADCTVEEREEYEPHLANGTTVYAGVDYAEIIGQASAEGNVLLWDGGNNDFPFVEPNLHLVLVDPLRRGNERTYHPGESVLRTADAVIVVKTNAAKRADVQAVTDAARQMAPQATVMEGASPVTLSDPQAVRGRRVLVIDDRPTLTHGGMPYGAGYVAATEGGAAKIVDPRDSACEDIAAVYRRYPHIGTVLPAVGYFPDQLRALQKTIADSDAEVIVSGTPCDLARLITPDRPWVRAFYAYDDVVGELKAWLDGRLRVLVTQFSRS